MGTEREEAMIEVNMKLLPKLYVALTVPTLGLLLAPMAPGQTRVWYQEVLTPTHDGVDAMASDAAGYVFQVKTVSPPASVPFGPWESALTRHTADGELTWTASIDDGGVVFPSGLASDGADGAFLVGVTSAAVGGANLGTNDAWITHYDVQGQRTWSRQIGTAASDGAETAAPDGAGGVYVGGWTYGSLAGSYQGIRDAWLARYSATGDQLWIRQFGTLADDQITGATLDSAGGVIVCGETFGNLAAQHSGLGDAFVARFDAAGTMTWSSQLGSAGREYCNDVTADGAGGAYVAGSTSGDLAGQNAGAFDAWWAHFDAAGTQTWVHQRGNAGGNICHTVLPDTAGGFFLAGIAQGDFGSGGSSAGLSWLGHFDASGNDTWITQFGAARGLAAFVGAPNRRGGVYLGGHIGAFNGPSSAWIARYDHIATETYCSPATVNSTGTDGKISASGSGDIAANDVVLRADDLPRYAFGFFLNSQSRDVSTTAGNPAVLCLGSPVGRFAAPSEIMNSGGAGSFSLPIDLTAMPQPAGALAVQPGETWHFQAWHRDLVGGIPTWNFTDGVSVMFR